MARSVAWRRVCSDAASWHQDEALNSTIYILREIGPTGFLLKEEGENKKLKVLLGDVHSCTCPVFKKEKDLCKHLCWVLLKKFRVPRQNPVTWQLGLVEREINEILRGIAAQQHTTTAEARRLAREASKHDQAHEGDDGSVKQREITEDDVCPICQEELLEKRLPVTYCKNGCGNNIHIKCMKVWAEHQQSQGAQLIKCPMCREDFGPFSLLQKEFRNSNVAETRALATGEHLGTTCRNCHVCPISGKCYRCTVCADVYLCQACFNTPAHSQHNFQFRQKSNQRWQPAQRGQGPGLPEAVIQNLMSRDITEEDYDVLLQLDSAAAGPLSDLTEETLRLLPLERTRTGSMLLQSGQQCRICLRPYQEGQYVRGLPCRHKFHRDCIDGWLLHQHPTCPVDGTVYTNTSVKQMQQANRARQQQTGTTSGNPGNGARVHPSNLAADPTLQIPGIGIARLGNSNVLDRHMNGVLEVSGITQSTNQNGERHRHHQRSPIEPPESYVYTRSGDYIDFAQSDTANDLRLLQNAATRSRMASQADTQQTLYANQMRHLGLDHHQQQLVRNLSQDMVNTMDSTYRDVNSAGSTSNGGRVRSVATSPAMLRRRRESNGLDFSNLILADVQRYSSPQTTGTLENVQSERHTVGDEGVGCRSVTGEIRTAGDHVLSPTVNLTIGNITEEADAITRANRGRLLPGNSGVTAAGRAALRRLAETQQQLNSRENGSADMQGHGGNHTEHDAPDQHLHASRNTQHVPSIPMWRNNNVSLEVTGELSSAQKPPSGSEASSRLRERGRLKSKPLHNSLSLRARSSSRERSLNMEQSRQQRNELYIGLNPSSAPDVNSSELMPANQDSAYKSQLAGRRGLVRRGRGEGNNQSEERYRWGATHQFSNDEIVLSGNAL